MSEWTAPTSESKCKELCFYAAKLDIVSASSWQTVYHPPNVDEHFYANIKDTQFVLWVSDNKFKAIKG